MDKKYLSVKEAAEYSGLSKWTIYSYSARGKLPVLKVGTRTLLPVKDFTDWLEGHKRVRKDEEGKDED